MKKIFFLSLLLSQIVFSQQITAKFTFFKNVSYDIASETKKFTLTQNNNFSIFETTNFKDENNFKYKDLLKVISKRDTILFYSINDNAIVCSGIEKTFKDFENNFQITNHEILFTHVYVKDKISMFDWTILNVNDTLIANYRCKKATTKFRGRDYVAYFTNEIANQGGPWKFDGLPGFILFVKSKDGYLSIEPTEIKITQQDHKEIKNPFENKILIPFEDLKKKVVEMEKKQWKRNQTEPNPPTKWSPGRSGGIEDIDLGERVYE